MQTPDVAREALAGTKDVEPFSGALYKEMLGRIKQTDISVPTQLRGYLYYSPFVAEK